MELVSEAGIILQELGERVEGLGWEVGGKLQQPWESLGTAVELGPHRGFLWVSRGRGRLRTSGISQGKLPLHQGETQDSKVGKQSVWPPLSSESAFTEHLLCARWGGLPNSDHYSIPAGNLEWDLAPSPQHSIGEEMEAQGDEVICSRSRSHGSKWSELGLEPRSRGWQS